MSITRSQASASAENYSKQKRGECLKDKRRIIVVPLVILGVLLAVSYLFLSQFMGIVLSAFLKQRVTVGKADIHHGLRFRDVTFDSGGMFLKAEEVLLAVKFHPTTGAGIEGVTLNRPVFSLTSADLRSFPGLTSAVTLPPVIVNQGTLILKGGSGYALSQTEIINVNYLNFSGFITETAFNAEFFADLELRTKKIPVRFRGRVLAAGKIPGSKICTRIYSSDFELGFFQIRDLTTCVKLNGNKLSMTEICGTLFDGLLSGSGQVDLDTKEYSLGCEVSGLNLEEVMKSLSLEKKDIKGRLDLRLRLAANAEGSRSIQGDGYVKIRDGQLWEVPVLYGLNTLILKPASKGAVFKEGGCDFKITGGALHTRNLRLMSADVGLAAEGKLGFDGKLDFLVTTAFSDEFMNNTPEMIKVTSLLSRILDFFIVQYRIGGTLSKPSYDLLPLPLITAIPLQIKKILRVLFPQKTP